MRHALTTHARPPRALVLTLACLLAAASWTMAQDSTPPLKLGGAIGINWAYGSYGTDHNPHRRGDKVGDADLDIFRLNADLAFHNVIGRVEYRWFDPYSMIHTAWLGYDAGDAGTVRAGIVRVPFGPTAYGVSSSYFFDQHWYVGLSDDMDLGVRWTGAAGALALDVGYFPSSEPQTDGSSLESSRYGYDVVRWEETIDADGTVNWGAGENGFEKRHQVNLRAIDTLDGGTEVGASLQYGLLQGTNIGGDDEGSHYALSAHMKNDFSGYTLHSQLTYYVYDITDDTPWGTGDLIPMGAYDFAWPVASEGIIPALTLRYNGLDTSGVAWLDGVTPYVEWSTILKTEEAFNDSTMVSLGAVWTIYGVLYMYSDLVLSDGNFFVGNDGDDYGNLYAGVGDFGASGNDTWNWRINFNYRYYF